jgi:L-ascorbate metabolism protein UlaG (beta-lactamase superfamily)
MRKIIFFTCLFFGAVFFLSAGTEPFEKDILKTAKGDLVMTLVGHGTLMFNFNNMVIHVDPVSGIADYGKLPKADLVLITHHHGDHLDLKAIALIKQEKTVIVAPEKCAEKIDNCLVMKNGDSKIAAGLKIEAVPAYNIMNKRGDGAPFHIKGEGNGYVVTFGDSRVYVAGDTENTPEMKGLKKIDVAFLPMNLPYTMTPEMVADAVKSFRPAIVYPYHYGKTDTGKLVELLKDEKNIEVRIRRIYPTPSRGEK